MKRINLRGLKEVLSEKELKNVLGGSGIGDDCDNDFGNGPCHVTGEYVHENGQHVYYNFCGVTQSHCLDLIAGDEYYNWVSFNCAC